MSDLPLSQPADPDFAEILRLIAAARQRAYQAVNTALIDLYWQIGEHLSRKIAAAEWGDGVVNELSRHIARTYPGLRGFTRSNLLRMRQFYETYRDHEIVSPRVRQLPEDGKTTQPTVRREIVAALLRQLPWTHHLIIISQCKRAEEREFYLRLAIREKWSTLIAEYQTKLPDKELLRAKLHEFYLQSQPQEEPS